MKAINRARVFSLTLTGVLAAGLIWAWKAPVLPAKADTTGAVKLTGYIIDEDCFVKAGYADPGKESRGCLLMKSCASSGYGVAVLQGDGTYKFYYFDGTFAPIPSSSSSSGGMGNMDMSDSSSSSSGATGGQALASAFITDKVEKSNIPVTVSGSLTSVTATNPNPKSADGKNYQVLKVDSIEQAAGITPINTALTGYLSDAASFLAAQQNNTDPTLETKDALLSSDAAAAGYGVVVKSGSAYRFYYLDGDLAPSATGGQAQAAALINASAKTESIEVSVSGSFEGHYGIYKDAQSVKHANPVVKAQKLAEAQEASSSSSSSTASSQADTSSSSAQSVSNPQTGETGVANGDTAQNYLPQFILAAVMLLATVVAAFTAGVKSRRQH